jgi:uncharacterized coiled-coil DUF342 family protein
MSFNNNYFIFNPDDSPDDLKDLQAETLKAQDDCLKNISQLKEKIRTLETLKANNQLPANIEAIVTEELQNLYKTYPDVFKIKDQKPHSTTSNARRTLHSKI